MWPLGGAEDDEESDDEIEGAGEAWDDTGEGVTWNEFVGLEEVGRGEEYEGLLLAMPGGGPRPHAPFGALPLCGAGADVLCGCSILTMSRRKRSPEMRTNERRAAARLRLRSF